MAKKSNIVPTGKDEPSANTLHPEDVQYSHRLFTLLSSGQEDLRLAIKHVIDALCGDLARRTAGKRTATSEAATQQLERDAQYLCKLFSILTQGDATARRAVMFIIEQASIPAGAR
jgi:hypothetical protein